MSKLSVIIPNFNREKKILTTLQNIYNQTLQPYEVIVVDDGSTDNSVDNIKTYFPKVTLIQQDNQGPGAARNTGLRYANGDYIQFMDSDDLLSLNKLEVQVRALEKNPQFDIAYGPWAKCDFQQNSVFFQNKIIQSRPLPTQKNMFEWSICGWFTILQSFLFKRSVLIDTGFFNTDMIITEDGEYLLRVLQKSSEPLYTPESLVFYRSNGEDQITSNGSKEQKRAKAYSLYYERVSRHISNQLEDLHPSTLKALNLRIYRHNFFCTHHGWPKAVILPSTKKSCLSSSRIPVSLLDYFYRVIQKIKTHQSLPGHIALQQYPPQFLHKQLLKHLRASL